MSASSLGESVTSVADSLVDDEFLPASPFHPRNVDGRRVVHESPRAAFQPRFVRMDSMDYRGKGIIEDMSDTAPVSASPSRPSPVKQFPAAGTEAARAPPAGSKAGPPMKSAALPPRPARPAQGSASAIQRDSRRLAEFSLDARRPKCAPIPQPPSLAVKTHPSRSPRHATTASVTPTTATSSCSEVDVALSSSSTASSTNELERPPLKHASSAGAAAPTRPPSGMESRKPSAREHPTRPRAMSSAAVLGVATSGAAPAGPPADTPAQGAHEDKTHQHCLQRRRTVPAAKVDALFTPTPPAVVVSQPRSVAILIAPLSPDAGPRLPPVDHTAPAAATSGPTTIGCVDRAALYGRPVERQWAAQSSNGQTRMNGTVLPPSMLASVGEPAGASSGTLPTVSPMPSLDFPTTESEGSGTASPRFYDSNGRRRSTRQPFRTSSETRTPSGSDVAVASSPLRALAGTSRVSAASSCCSPTPVATPSAALNLTATASSAASSPLPTVNVTRPPLRGHGTLSVDTTRSQTAAVAPPPPPPTALPTQLIGGRRVPAPASVPACAVRAPVAPFACEPVLSAEQEDQRLLRRRLNLATGNEAFLRQAKASPGPRSLLDASAASFADSVRRDYYNLPSQSESTVPHFARPTGDLHVRKAPFSHILAAAMRSPVKAAAGPRPDVSAEPTTVPVPPRRPSVESVPSSTATPQLTSPASYSLVWLSPQSDPRSPQTPARPCDVAAQSSPRGVVRHLASVEPFELGNTVTSEGLIKH